MDLKSLLGILTILIAFCYWVSRQEPQGSALKARSEQVLFRPTVIQPSSPGQEPLKNLASPQASLIRPQRIQQIKNWIAFQAVQVNRLQKDPSKIDAQLEQLASELSMPEGLALMQTAGDVNHSQNERAVILDLLTRNPERHTQALLSFISRSDFPSELDLNHVHHSDPRQEFEIALSVQVIAALEKSMVRNPALQNKVAQILESDLPSSVRDQLRLSLVSAKNGKMFWNEKAAALHQGALQ